MAKKRSNDSGSDPIDAILAVNDPTPLLAVVDGEEMFCDLLRVLKQHIIMDDCCATAMALWVISVYCYEQFQYSPLLLINAPEKACGKSVALSVVAKLVPKPLECTNITVAALFRVVENRRPTLLIDEADTFLEGKNELAGILNKGYEKGGVVLRVETVGDRYQEVAYRVFGPKALAGIALERHLPDATLSRGIPIAMRRKKKDESVVRLRHTDPSVFSNLRSRIHKFVSDHHDQLVHGYSELPEQLSDREQDCWEPLFAVASCIGPFCIDLACKSALDIKSTAPEAQSVSNNLLLDIREVLFGHSGLYIPTVDLLDKLTADPEMGWGSYNRGQPLTARQLSRNIQQYGVRSKTVRVSAKSTPKGYEVRDFEDAFIRYLPEFERDINQTHPSSVLESKAHMDTLLSLESCNAGDKGPRPSTATNFDSSLSREIG
jgi:hypothetical protein